LEDFIVDRGIILTFNLLTWRIWCAPTNSSKWQMGFNLAFKGVIKILEIGKENADSVNIA